MDKYDDVGRGEDEEEKEEGGESGTSAGKWPKESMSLLLLVAFSFPLFCVRARFWHPPLST